MCSREAPFGRNSNLDELNAILRDFEHAWLHDASPPDVRKTFAAHDCFGSVLLKQLVVLNYDLAWDAYRKSPSDTPEPAPVRVYRRAFPETDGDDDLLFELLFLEIANWENPEEQYYVEMYPQLTKELRSVFEVLKLFRPEQFRGWAGSVTQLARAQQDDSHSILLNHRLAPAASNRASVATGSEEQTEAQPPLEDGATIHLADSCRISGETIGVGAFKRVYQGYQASTGRTVAVKQLVRLTTQGVQNFASEVRAQAKLDHQNIPPVMLLGSLEGQPALLLEKLILAPDWSTIIGDRNQQQRHLDILLTVSRAAEYAHREFHLIHRDIKPQNVLVGEYREVYLVDWGLAVQIGDGPSYDDSVRQLRDEPDGYIVGPPSYMAPEMAMGRNQECTPATDVFLLGAILYEILSGHPPYDAYPRAACMRAAAYMFPELPDDSPEELKSITLRAMARQPAERFADAGHFADALERYLSHQEAENQLNRAEIGFRKLREELRSREAQRRDAPALLTSLIASADQYHQAGQLWEQSTGAVERHQAAESVVGKQRGPLKTASSRNAAGGLAESSESCSTNQPDEFTKAGIERARSGECKARQQLVLLAIESGDLALAQSQIDALAELKSPHTDELQAYVLRALKRRQSDRRQRLTAAAAALLLLIASLAFWQQRTSANARAMQSEKERVVAESARQLAEARSRRKAADARAAQAEVKRQIAELTAASERIRRSESRRLNNLESSARAADFTQAQVLFRAASLMQMPTSDSGFDDDLLESRQLALTPHLTSSRRILTGSVLLSPDAQWMLSADVISGAIRVWSTATWAQSFRLVGHQEPENRGGLWGTVRGMVFDPRDSSLLYSAGMDGTLRAWDLSKRQEVHRWEPEIGVGGNGAEGRALMSLAGVHLGKSPADLHLIAGRRDGTLFVLQASSMEAIRTLKAHEAEVVAIATAPDGSRFASAASDGVIKIWNTAFEELTSLTHPEQIDVDDAVPLFDISWSPDGAFLAASGGAVTIPIWETANWSLKRSLAGHPTSLDGSTRVRTLLWPLNDQLFSGGADGVIRIWNPKTGKQTGELNGHKPNMYGRRGVLSLGVAPQDPSRLVSSGRDATIRVWDLPGGSITHTLEGADIAERQSLQPPVIHSAYIAETDQLVIAMPSSDSPIRLWNAESLREVRQFPLFSEPGDDDPERRVQGLAVSPDGQRFVTSELNGNLVFWSANASAPLKVVKAQTVPAKGLIHSHLFPLAFSLDGRHLVSLSTEGKMRLWDTETFEEIGGWSAEDPSFTSVVSDQSIDNSLLFVDKNLVISSGRDRFARFWDVETGTIVRRIEHVAPITCASLDRKRQKLAMGTSNGNVQIRDISDADRAPVIYAASFEPIMDGSRFGPPLRVSEARRKFAERFQRRWSVRVHSIAFSSDAGLLSVTLGDGSLTLVQMETGRLIGRGVGHMSKTGFAPSIDTVFTRHGRLLTIGDDHAVRQWELNPWRDGRAELPGSDSSGSALQLAAGSKSGEWTLASGKELLRWRAADDHAPVKWKIEDDGIESVVAIPDSDDFLLGTSFGRAIRLCGTDNTAALTFAGRDGRREFTHGMPGGTKVAVSSDGQLAATSWLNGQIDIWKLTDGSAVRTIPGSVEPSPDHAVEAVALNRDGTQLAATNFAGELHIWDLTQPDRNELLFQRTGPQQAAGLEYTPDGSRLVQAGLEWNSEIIVVWETSGFEKVASLHGHRPVDTINGGQVRHVLDLDISPDGRWLATCGSDATVRVWGLKTDSDNAANDRYEPFAVLSTRDLSNSSRPTSDPSTWLTSVAFHGESHKLAVSGLVGPVYVFDLDIILRERHLPASERFRRAEKEMGLRLENDRPVPVESLRMVPTGV